MFDETVKGRIKMLIYPIQFEKDPLDGLERVFKTVLAPQSMKLPLSDYAETIKVALESSEDLSSLIAKNHSEESIRRYLGKLLERIQRSN
jgi:hypothetical protein